MTRSPQGAPIIPGFGRNKKIVVFAAAIAAGLAFLIIRDLPACIDACVGAGTHPVLFIFLMTTLPLFGFPICVFLVLAGVKFGAAVGFLVTAATFLIHFLVFFFVAGSFLRPRLERWIAHKGIRIPEIDPKRAALLTFGFVAVPGIPYIAKSSILALSGIPFRYYILIGWGFQVLRSIPLLGAGKAATATYLPFAFLIFPVMLLAGFGLTRFLRRKGYFSALR